MDLKQQILHYYRVDELSLREIARRTGIDRKTVTRLINAYEAAIKTNPETGIDEFLATRPKYTTRQTGPRVVRDAVKKEIDKWLKENERRRNNGMRKQCLKCKDIHRELLEKGLSVSYSSICKYVRKKKYERTAKPKDVYLRIHREPGVECEFDWGEVKLFIAGKPVSLMMAVFCFPYSKGRMAYLFHRQDTLAFMESHRNFFRDIHGVPKIMVYDNMRVAVVFDQKEKKPTTALLRMSTFYKYDWRFCNARAGWEKGNVERSVDYVRGRAFTTRVDFETIDQAQEWLMMICQNINSEAASASTSGKTCSIQEELRSLQTYPGEIGCFELFEYKVDKQSTICVKTNHYSVPDNMVGETVIVQMYSEKIVIFNNAHKKIARHIRSNGSNEWIVDINHYISTLMKKTSAIQYSEAFHQMPASMQVIYHKFFKDNGKEFLKLVKYVRDNDIAYEEVVDAADQIRWNGVKTFTADHFKVALQAMLAKDEPFREDQMNDEFIEIETGSEDILTQLENVMENGAKLSE
ncbi:MAG: IS21 family transposase [Bacteroidales bacterium]|nr:IS21 family transposase [Bacteroidales bacterium]